MLYSNLFRDSINEYHNDSDLSMLSIIENNILEDNSTFHNQMKYEFMEATAEMDGSYADDIIEEGVGEFFTAIKNGIVAFFKKIFELLGKLKDMIFNFFKKIKDAIFGGKSKSKSDSSSTKSLGSGGSGSKALPDGVIRAKAGKEPLGLPDGVIRAKAGEKRLALPAVVTKEDILGVLSTMKFSELELVDANKLDEISIELLKDVEHGLNYFKKIGLADKFRRKKNKEIPKMDKNKNIDEIVRNLLDGNKYDIETIKDIPTAFEDHCVVACNTIKQLTVSPETIFDPNPIINNIDNTVSLLEALKKKVLKEADEAKADKTKQQKFGYIVRAIQSIISNIINCVSKYSKKLCKDYALLLQMAKREAAKKLGHTESVIDTYSFYLDSIVEQVMIDLDVSII